MSDPAVRPIIIKKRRPAAHAAHHGSAWKVAYADFVTAMMAFFMLLWLISAADEDLKKGLADYFSLATEQSPASASQQRTATPSPAMPMGRTAAGEGRMGGVALIPTATLVAQASELRLALERDPAVRALKAQLAVTVTPEGVRIELFDSGRRAMFAAGTAIPTPAARALLGAVARALASGGARLAVAGHTDAQGGDSDANWLLSSGRGHAARRALTGAGLPVARIAEVAGEAANRPALPGEPSRAENRRVSLLVLAETPSLPLELGLAR